MEANIQSQILGLRVAGTIFGLVCLIQLIRLLTQFEVVVAGYPIPIWASAIVVVVSGGLSGWLWKLAKRA